VVAAGAAVGPLDMHAQWLLREFGERYGVSERFRILRSALGVVGATG
jgi:hypothetical protein